VLIRDAIHANIPVVPIPGASALLSALVGSGMNTHHFLYLGFLPVKKGRKTLFEKLKEKEQTVVIYESPHRLLHTLENIQSTFGESHPIVIARELTKKFEEFRRETVAASLAHFTKTAPKGEFVICF
jgi:16S rRNA (cytidine1402-2'-O)-methyltransferase